jgi:hypothetical protein
VQEASGIAAPSLHIADPVTRGDAPFPAVDLLPASTPRLSLLTVADALTDWESMIAADGSGLRPAVMRHWRSGDGTQHGPTGDRLGGTAGG